MSSREVNRIAQIVLIGVWVFIIAANFTLPVNSQDCPQPQYMDPIFIWRNSWVPGTQVTVEIDSFFPEDQRHGIETGNSAWNNLALVACSGVRFLHFDQIFMEDYEETPPLGHLRWQKDDPGNGKNGIVLAVIGFGGFVEAARIQILPSAPNVAQGTYYHYLGSHEVGHTFNLKDCISTTGCIGTEPTIMRGHSDGITSSNAFNTSGPKDCDISKVKNIYCSPPTPTPTPTPDWPWPDPFPPTDPETCQSGGWFWNFSNSTCNRELADATCGSTRRVAYYLPLDGGGCNNADDYCAFPYGCPPGSVDGGRGCCCVPTPVLIDVAGNGFSLTDAYNGVMFDMGGDGKKEPVAWTTADNDDAWRVLDRNGNGQVDSAKEMFGNFTEQPHATTRLNGFVALAEFDRSDNGGNGDGKITSVDSVFANLKLWQDKNRNGVAEQGELFTLPTLNIATLELDYKESKKSDANGNRFSYRAKVKDAQGNQVGRWAWDVTLSANPPPKG